MYCTMGIVLLQLRSILILKKTARSALSKSIIVTNHMGPTWHLDRLAAGLLVGGGDGLWHHREDDLNFDVGAARRLQERLHLAHNGRDHAAFGAQHEPQPLA